jgi:hypothetical protein
METTLLRIWGVRRVRRVFSLLKFSLLVPALPDTWALVLAIEKGYVIDEAAALLRAANKKVVAGEGFERFSRDSRVYFNTSFKKNVIDGLSVRINVAEYPDQNPLRPFSDLICAAISLVFLFDAAVCFLVTIFASGVVKSFETWH